MKRSAIFLSVIAATATAAAAGLARVQQFDVSDPDAQGYTGVYYQPDTGFVYAEAATGDGRVLFAADPAHPGLVALYDTATGTFRDIHAVDVAEAL